MIFVTLGTTKFQFNRLMETLDTILIENNSNEQLIIQDNSQGYKFKYNNVLYFSELPLPQIIEYLSTARIIITHGGPASVFLSLKFGKNRPIIVPRDSIYKEHVNNHQLVFLKSVYKKYSFETIFPEHNIKIKLSEFLKKPKYQTIKNKISCSPKLIANLNQFCENLKIIDPLR